MQLSLPVSLIDNETFDTFYPENNELLLAYVQTFLQEGLDVSQKPLVVLYGKASAGKSHLLYACCHSYRRLQKEVMYIDMHQLCNMPTQVIEGISRNALVCIDNLNAIVGNRGWEVAIFDLINQCMEKKEDCKLILSLASSPIASGFQLPDLISRLTWGAVFQLSSHDDTTLSHILRLRLSERGLQINDETIRFLLTRVERDLGQLMKVIVELDEKSLQAKRKLTIPFIKEALSL